jgi:hypothetical protein
MDNPPLARRPFQAKTAKKQAENTCVQFATLREHLSIPAERPTSRRDSAIPFNHIDARPNRVIALTRLAGFDPAAITRGEGDEGLWKPRPV